VTARDSRLYVLYLWVTSSPFSVVTRHAPFSILERFKDMPNGRRFVHVRLPIILIEKKSYGSLCGKGLDTRPVVRWALEDGSSQ
jgi:hypothetical protein